MFDKVWKKVSDKRSAGKRLIPIVVGLSGAMWLGAASAYFYLKDKPIGKTVALDDPARAAADDADKKAELAGLPATAGAAEAKSAVAEPLPVEAAASDAKRSGSDEKGASPKRKQETADPSGEGSRAMANANADEATGEAPAGEDDSRSWPTREEMAALRQVAELRISAGQLEEAVAPLRRVMRVPTHDAALLALAAKVFLGTANYAEAFSFAKQLVDLDPADMTARVQAVEAQYRLGQVEGAILAAQAALKQHPGDLAMLVQLGTMQVERGPGSKGYGEALATALKLKRDYAPAIYLQGRKAQLEGDFKDAEAAFAKVVKLEPGNVKALGQLGMAEYHLGKKSQAEKSFRGELARNPADYNTWYNLGELLLGRADEETNSEAVRHFRADAMECYLKAIDLNPDHAQARYRVGVLLNGNGQYKEAIRYLEAALRLDSHYVPTLVQLALAYEYLKQPERARAYLNKAYELDPLNKVVLSKLHGLS